MDNIEFVELQKRILNYFKDSKVKNFKDTLQKDKNGYNWILTFHELRLTTAMVGYTKIIFKLDENKEYVRKNDFLYLKNIPFTYKILKFKSLKMIESIFDEIFNKNLFGNNSIAISEFLIEPERNINNYFADKNINNYSVFEFIYLPDMKMKNTEFYMYFKMNVNNNQNVNIKLEYSDNKGYKIIFDYLNNKKIVYIKELNELYKYIAEYIIQNL